MLSFLMYTDDTTIYFNLEDFPIYNRHIEINRELDIVNTWLNPIRSGGGGALKAPPPIFCSHAFNFGAALLCVGDFFQKIV